MQVWFRRALKCVFPLSIHVFFMWVDKGCASKFNHITGNWNRFITPTSAEINRNIFKGFSPHVISWNYPLKWVIIAREWGIVRAARWSSTSAPPEVALLLSQNKLRHRRGEGLKMIILDAESAGSEWWSYTQRLNQWYRGWRMTRGMPRGRGAPETDACSKPEESNLRKKKVGSINSVDMTWLPCIVNHVINSTYVMSSGQWVYFRW